MSAVTQASENLHLRRIRLHQASRSRPKRSNSPLCCECDIQLGENCHGGGVRAGHLDGERSLYFVLRRCGFDHRERGIHRHFRNAAKGRTTRSLYLEQRGIREVARRCTESFAQPGPPVLMLAVRRMDFCQFAIRPPHLDADWRKAALASHRNRYLSWLRHSVVPLSAKDCTRDRSHLRSSIASAVQLPVLKFPFLLPRGAPGLSPPWRRHRRRSRIAGHSHGEPARVLAPQRGARLRFPSRVSVSWFMGLCAIFYCPLRPECGVRSADALAESDYSSEYSISENCGRLFGPPHFIHGGTISKISIENSIGQSATVGHAMALNTRKSLTPPLGTNAKNSALILLVYF